MRLKYFILWGLMLFVSMSQSLYSQCPTGNITLNSQADVDNFRQTFANCTELNGSLILQGNDISNVDSLAHITSIQGNLEIQETQVNLLKTTNFDIFTGLQNVTGDLIFTQSIQTLDFPQMSMNLPALQSVGGDFKVTTSGDSRLIGFNQLQSVGGAIEFVLGTFIFSNFGEISGFGLLSEVESLTLKGNPDISGFASLEYVPGDVDIEGIFLQVVELNAIKKIGGNLEYFVEEDGKIVMNALEEVEGFINLESFIDVWEGGEGFNQLQKVGGKISLFSPKSVSGFERLKEVGFFLEVIAFEPIETLSGFDSLRTIGADLFIEVRTIGDHAISGFPQLDSIGGSFNLYRPTNSNLGTLNLDLTAFERLSYVAGNFRFTRFPDAVNCCGLFNVLNTGSIGGTINISDNAPGCNSVAEILENCQDFDASIAAFHLFDANTDQFLLSLEDGAIINADLLNTLFWGIEIITAPAIVGSVELVLDGPLSLFRIENTAPYSLYGNSGSDIFGENFLPGTYTLRATPQEDVNGGGSSGTPREITFTVVAPNLPPLEVVDIQLYDADRNVLLGSITEGSNFEIVDLSNTQLGIVALTAPNIVGSVSFDLTGTQFPNGFSRTEGFAPYSIFGDVGIRNINGRIFTPGNYTLEVTPFEEKLAQGEAGLTTTVNFSLQEPEQISVSDFVLYDALSNLPIQSIQDGEEITIEGLANRRFNIVAETNPPLVGSVEFVLSGTENRVQLENVAPYALFQDNNGDFFPETLEPGLYNLTATPFTEANKGGKQGQALSIQFTLVDGANTNQISVFPNPSEQGSITLSQSGTKVTQVELYSPQGMLIYQGSLTEKQTLENLLPGQYILKSYFADQVKTVRIHVR